ncbi:hypothetical protein [Acinetobacter sp. V115_6]|uniref:hypothetical protein n=1 Tax=Acinetobacter sp. V115_6 TaxID=3072987 RepID=UPI00287C7087|nr:hypothetical protein [Acinetobacter sp. V115_6]MDS7927616.1 hypothetical protein [Acinetobacter sp. V115_6]
MEKPNKELLQAFIDWFMREYSNFGGKPIAERYEEAFDTFNNDFIDARYDAFQDGWKVQQAKVEELQNHATEIHKREIKLFEKTLILTHERDELQKRVDMALELCKKGGALSACLAMRVEQALKGEGCQ